MTRHLDRPAPSPPMLPSRTLIDHLGWYRGRCRDVLSLQMSSTTSLLIPLLLQIYYYYKRWPPPKLGLLDKTPAFEGAAGKECLERDSYHLLFQCFEMYQLDSQLPSLISLFIFVWSISETAVVSPYMGGLIFCRPSAQPKLIQKQIQKTTEWEASRFV